MDDQDRIDLILTQAQIAKAAIIPDSNLSPAQQAKNLNRALLAIDAIELLADPDFHNSSNAA